MGLTVVKNLVDPGKYSIKCPHGMTPEFIVVHNTANDASAANEIAYMIRNDDETSFHYAIDDKQIVQGIPENRNAWHAGDDGSGKGNRKGIGIEICYSLSGGSKFIAAEKLAAKFIAEKLKEKGWGIDKVKKHQDFSGKYCPHRTLDMGWQRFLDMVKDELNALNTPAGDVFYRVQVGAYKKIDNAEKQLAKVKAAGFDGFITRVNEYYKIQVGAYKEKKNARNMLARINEAGFEAFITTNGGQAVSATSVPKPSTATFVVGDKVKLKNDAIVYGTSNRFADFVYRSTLYVREISGSRVVISTVQSGAVTGAVDVRYLTKT